MKKCLVILAVLIASPAFAQQSATPEVQALQSKLMQELNNSLQCTAQTITLQQQVTKLTADFKAMKDKYEPEPKK